MLPRASIRLWVCSLRCGRTEPNLNQHDRHRLQRLRLPVPGRPRLHWIPCLLQGRRKIELLPSEHADQPRELVRADDSDMSDRQQQPPALPRSVPLPGHRNEASRHARSFQLCPRSITGLEPATVGLASLS